MTITGTTTSAKLRHLADLLDLHDTLPAPFISGTSYNGIVEAAWHLHIWGGDLAEQKATAASIIRTLGGSWDKAKRKFDDSLELTQDRDEVTLRVVVARAAVCERVVVGTREVTTPAMPARPAEPERVDTVEEVTWVCSSLLADADAVPASAA